MGKRMIAVFLVLQFTMSAAGPATIRAEDAKGPAAEVQREGMSRQDAEMLGLSYGTEGQVRFIADSLADEDEALSIHNGDEAEGNYHAAQPLPEAYDLRAEGCVTSVKNQSYFGVCWAHAALAAGESCLLKKKLAPVGSLDLSERHLAYFTFHPAADPLDNTAGAHTTTVGKDYLMIGASSRMAVLTMAGWKGAADEKDAPYKELEDAYLASGRQLGEAFYSRTDLPPGLAYQDSYHLQNAYHVALRDRDDVKRMLMRYGALHISCNSISRDSYTNFNRETASYYSPNLIGGHAVAIVGWDDHFSRENFCMPQPKKDGAWLIKNSKGTGFGDRGYYWISYEDAYLNRNEAVATVFDMERSDNYDNNYQYDGTAHLDSGRIASRGSIAAVYKVSANPNGAELLKAVSFALADVNVDYRIQIYRNLTDRADPESGIPALETPVTGKTSYEGYYTIPLETELPLAENSLYSIVIQLSKSEDAYVYYRVDSTGEVMHSGGFGTIFYSAAGRGRTFWKFNEEAAWGDFGGTEKGYCARIKGFTDNMDSLPFAASLTLDQSELTLQKGESSTLATTVRPVEKSGARIYWSSSNPDVATVDVSGRVTAQSKSGMAVITASVNDGSGVSAACPVTVVDYPQKGTVLSFGRYRYKVVEEKATVALVGAESHASTVTVPASVRIGEIKYKVTSIGAGAFKNDKKLKKLTVGKNVVTIGDNAFSVCKKLKSVTVGTGVKTIGKKAFYRCGKLSSITIKSAKLTAVGKNALKGISARARIKVPSRKVAAYRKLLKGKGQGKKVRIVD